MAEGRRESRWRRRPHGRCVIGAEGVERGKGWWGREVGCTGVRGVGAYAAGLGVWWPKWRRSTAGNAWTTSPPTTPPSSATAARSAFGVRHAWPLSLSPNTRALRQEGLQPRRPPRHQRPSSSSSREWCICTVRSVGGTHSPYPILSMQTLPRPLSVRLPG